jgi:hypothetical protein
VFPETFGVEIESKGSKREQSRSPGVRSQAGPAVQTTPGRHASVAKIDVLTVF